MFHNHHSGSQGRPSNPSCRLPEVAEDPRQEPQGERTTHAEADDLADFKVFLKRNLRSQAPPADLLAGIRARIDDISAKK